MYGLFFPSVVLAQSMHQGTGTNRIFSQYPITGSLMKPASNPTHYTDLLKELQAAPERGFIDRILNKWKGVLRFQ